MTTPGPQADKRRWREWARDAAAGLEPVDVAVQLAGWAGIGADTRVLLYDPLPGEPGLGDLAGRCDAYITRTPPDGGLTVHPFDSEREIHSLGFSQPVAGSTEIAPELIDVALVPGVAFDRSGTRLGHGTGYYDRLLAQLRPDVAIVGVAPQGLVVDLLPAEPHDHPMTHLATEHGIRPMVDRNHLMAARAWMEGDPDDSTRSALADIIERGDAELLAEVMGSPLRFGTAGIRGEVGPGPARMNRAVVIRTTKGLADYLASRGRVGAPVVVGYDGRTDSPRFAADTIGVLRAAGLAVVSFGKVVPTPLVSFAAGLEEAAAAVVITASHNPPQDNGYKVYDSNQAQIVPPVDGDIAAAIDSVGPAASIPREPVEPSAEGGLGVDVEDRYVAAVMAFRGEAPAGESIPIAYTALHGVGGPLALRVLAEGGHGRVDPVAEQHDPDGSFPTVAFPNPEEPGAMDRVEELGAARDAQLVLANDPDADRLGVSVREGAGWRRLTGNEIGWLLGDFVLERTSGPERLVISSIVSSPMLGAIAAAHDAAHEVTLTGFKWICNAALDLEAQGMRFVFGYEEALGYTVGPVVRDKDGISAALWFADLAAVLAERGESIPDRLDTLHDRHGLWVSRLHSVRLDGAAGSQVVSAALSRLVDEPPAELAGEPVTTITDYRRGESDRPRWLPSARLVEAGLGDGSRVLVRPSGTEPKLKMYADIRGVAEGDRSGARAAADDRAGRVIEELSQHLGLG